MTAVLKYRAGCTHISATVSFSCSAYRNLNVRGPSHRIVLMKAVSFGSDQKKSLGAHQQLAQLQAS
jgi:hypothetical protein